MIIGFGTTETAYEEALESAFTEHVKERHADLKALYFDDAFIESVTKWLMEQGEKSREIAETYKDAPDHPDRYSSFYPHITSSPSAIVALVTFHHINRRHGLSQDGWALMRNERTFTVWERDCPRRVEAA